MGVQSAIGRVRRRAPAQVPPEQLDRTEQGGNGGLQAQDPRPQSDGPKPAGPQLIRFRFRPAAFAADQGDNRRRKWLVAKQVL